MNCDKCQRRMNYTFYINDEHWRKVVGEEAFSKSVGRWCAHCTLDALGGLDWYVIHNEPQEHSHRYQRETDAAATPPSIEIATVGLTYDEAVEVVREHERRRKHDE